VPLAVVGAGVLACALIIAAARPEAPAALAGRGARGSLRTQLRGVHKARLSMLDEECISWRGCTGRYTPDTMDLNNPDTEYPDLGQGQSFYDRFDNFPNAWDASPAAAYVRDLYPGGYPAFAHEEPSVIVGGDTTKAYPFQVCQAPRCRCLPPASPFVCCRLRSLTRCGGCRRISAPRGVVATTTTGPRTRTLIDFQMALGRVGPQSAGGACACRRCRETQASQGSASRNKITTQMAQGDRRQSSGHVCRSACTRCVRMLMCERRRWRGEPCTCIVTK